MLSKSDLLQAMLKDIEICRHLLTKVPEGGMAFRPTEGQRSTEELLRYLSFCGIGGSMALYEGGWEGYKSWAERCAELGPDDFDAALTRHAEALTAWFDELSDEDFAKRPATTPLGEEMPLGRALLEMPVKWLAAYRMQLFLYAKQSGCADLWTPNCWGGVDMERPDPA